ncbi:DMT family transporter [Ketogulonicigenium vulgare]|uniref:Drug/metabolite transporter (DMT) permease superfamily protein n=1 Tax=Ketogulonicigenium vulgare (strain WSH-001) TaxID=759362 RepID=F9Y4A9_KETVW|nr:DMT family transporter [Ketogulonicigenium vulgare]ADO43438.1 putative transporter [Ketogulonicigenium vulgare Y25]AEM41722.1 Drug/metabolite transporter (DMT) permease superfamily protein [Ketogulonicigenium vulgare WSH-001]ALJ81830.1 multidrug DMT transporter permease [Ketogulonicigenium vulgare]ANW34486.1 multidrug DMT transporter permease [Ketogulonicigenium vulgare]AOZ55475.1 transporter [Ketogulonicigenium vulgare]
MLTRLWNSPQILLTLASLFWAGNFVVGRAILTEAPPVAMAFWRWALAIIPVVLVARGRVDVKHELALVRRHWLIIVVLGVLGISCFNTFVYLGLRETASINALLMQSAMPLLILLACFVLYRERPLPQQIIGVVLSLGGVIFIAARGHLETLTSLGFNTGDLWVLAAVVAYTFYSALLRKKPAMHPLSFLVALFIVGALALLPPYLTEHASGQVMRLTPQMVAALAYLVIFPSFLSYLCFNRGVELLGAGRAGLFIHLLPVFGSALAVIFLGERFESFHLIGAVLIGVGLLVAARRGRSARRKMS